MNLTQDLREALSLAKTQQAEIVRLGSLVDEARVLLVNLVGLIDGEWGYGAADDERDWIAKVDGKEPDNG